MFKNILPVFSHLRCIWICKILNPICVRFNHQKTAKFLNSQIIPKPLRMKDDISQFIFKNDQPFAVFDVEKAFNGLNKEEKVYAHYLSKASWCGGLIVAIQTSPEAPLIVALLHELFKEQTTEELKQNALKTGVDDEEFQAFLVYACGVYANMGNYKGFGDTKFIPNLPVKKFETIVKSSSAFKKDKDKMTFIWENCNNGIYSLNDHQKQLGLGSKGVTAYFSSNCSEKDAELSQEYLKEKGLEPYNTRLCKSIINDMPHYQIRIASAAEKDDPQGKLTCAEHDFRGCTFSIKRGDYSPLMEKVVHYLNFAKKAALNKNEVEMLTHYIASFNDGSIDEHKNGSRFWIKNKSPPVECYIGFIETYRDPSGIRGEFEGFVAMVNKEMSKKFQNLVSNAEKLLTLLPWGTHYEKDTFLNPDFTSLDILAFSGSGVPSGINIPNYDDIRQNEGFKNVSLGNVIPAGFKGINMAFLVESDQTLVQDHGCAAFEMQVGLHELLGHGSGKLFMENKDGTLNFKSDEVTHLLTKEKIKSYYRHGDSYDTKFTTLASAYEECRAECVGLYMCLDETVQQIFGHKGEEAEKIVYVNWLTMVWKGLGSALEVYNVSTKSWLQAHSQARHLIGRVLLDSPDKLVTIKEITGSDGKPDLRITLDRTKIMTAGKKAIGDLLRKLQVYKSTADFDAAQELFKKYTSVEDTPSHPFLQWRKIIMDRKEPRKIFVQPNTNLMGDEVELVIYEPTAEGMIKSWRERFQDLDVSNIMMEQWKKDKPYYTEG